MRLVLNIIWFVLAGLWLAIGYAFAALICFIVLCGWWLALAHLVTGAVLCLTIIGIGLGLANFELIPVSLLPFGREIVSVEDARAMGAVDHAPWPPPT